MKARAWTALVFALVLFGCFATARGQQQNYTVVDIVIEGNQRASQSLISGVASIFKGSALTPTSITETISRLYGLGIFSDVRVEAEPVTGGLKVYIVVVELPKLIGLEFEGNDKIDSKDLKEDLNLGIGGYISQSIIYAKAEEIRQMYAKKGYFRAVVDFELNYGKDSTESILTYKINERSKVKVEKVVMTGPKRVEAEDLIKKMRNRKRGFLKSSNFAQDKYAEDLEKIVNEYHKLGFLDAYVISDSNYIDTTRNRMTIYLDLYEGPRYYFGTNTFKNNTVIEEKFLAKAIKFDEGDIFDLEKYDESIMELYSTYQEVGHLHVQIADDRTTRSDSLIDISYDITEGLPSHINLVKITGNSKTKEKVIRRELSVYPKQKFNRSLLIRSVRDVMALNYFANVIPNPVPLPNGDVDIEFEVEEKQTGQVSAGAGYNSQDKLVGNLGMGIPNFRGNGQSVNFSIDFGSRRNSFSLAFTEPWMFGRPTLLGLDAYTLNRRWFSDYTEGRQGGSVKLGRRLRWPDRYTRVFTSYRIERNRFHDMDLDYIISNSYKAIHLQADTNVVYSTAKTDVHEPYPGSIPSFGEEWHASSKLSLTISRDTRNLPEFATSGSSISYRIEHTGGFLGGFWTYQKHSITVAKFFPMFWGIALAAKVQYGAITSKKDDSHILVSDRFTPGGTAYDGIVRGYDDGILTPDSLVTQSDTIYYYSDPLAEPGVDPPDSSSFTSFRTRVRGKYMLTTNLEIQIPLVKQQIYSLLFFDAGNSWLHQSSIKPFSSLYRSVGIGFRVVVPGIGTIGFDFGYPLDNFRGRIRKWKPHFQMGTTFR